jgi:competence protein ComFB
MGFRDIYDFESLVNEAERLVVEELDRQLSGRSDLCRCQECVLDMAAYALNQIKPHYRVSLMGTLYASAIDQTEDVQEIKQAVREAIAKIQSNPAHP